MFLVFIVGEHGIQVDEWKIKAIKEWSIPKTMDWPLSIEDSAT